MMPLPASLQQPTAELLLNGARSEGQAADGEAFGALLDKPVATTKAEATATAPVNEGELPVHQPWSALRLLLAVEPTKKADVRPDPDGDTSTEETSEEAAALAPVNIPTAQPVADVPAQIATEARDVSAPSSEETASDGHRATADTAGGSREIITPAVPAAAAVPTQTALAADANAATNFRSPGNETAVEAGKPEVKTAPVVQPTVKQSAPQPPATPVQAIAAAAQAAQPAAARQPTRTEPSKQAETGSTPQAVSASMPAAASASLQVETVARTPLPASEPVLRWSPLPIEAAAAESATPLEEAAVSPKQQIEPSEAEIDSGLPAHAAAPAASAPSAAAPALPISPAAPLALDPAKQPALIEAARQVTEAEISGQAAQPTESLKLRLNPLHLGIVTAVLTGSGNGLAVELQVESAEAHARLTQEKDAIGKALGEIGIDVERITVQHVQTAAQMTARDGDFSGSFPQADTGTRHDATQGNRGENRGSQPAPHRGGSNGPGENSAGHGQHKGDPRADGGRYI